MFHRRLPAFCVAAALAAPNLGFAGTIVLPDVLTDGSVDPKKVKGVHSLISSELEFAPGVDGVEETTSAGLTAACFVDPRCLADIAKKGGGDEVLAGNVTRVGNEIALDLVYFSGGTIARSKRFMVPTDSTAMANEMTSIVGEMLTGQGADGGTAAAAVDDFSDLPEEDDSIAVGVAPVPAYTPTPQPAYQPPPPQPVYQPPAPAPTYAPPPQPTADQAAAMISFGNATNEISAEAVDAMIQFGTPQASGSTYTPPPQPTYQQPPPQPAYQPPPQPAYQPAPQPYAPAPQPYDNDLAREALEANQPKVVDLDEGDKKGGSGRTGSKATIERGVANTMQITARGGYAKYFVFDFATVGGELAVPVYEGFHLLAGVEGYAVNRVLPPELQLATGIYSEWNTIFPANVGGMYKFTPGSGLFQPYVGGDIIFVQYYKDEIGADWAGGARLRTGADIMVAKNFGLNVNVAVGGWTGKNWSLIEQGLQQSGLLPQVSGGTVIAF